MSAWEEGLKQARQACEAWKKETETARRAQNQAEQERTKLTRERDCAARERDMALRERDTVGNYFCCCGMEYCGGKDNRGDRLLRPLRGRQYNKVDRGDLCAEKCCMVGN